MKWSPHANFSHSFAQSVYMLNQQTTLAFQQVNREKIGTTGNAIAAIVWHLWSVAESSIQSKSYSGNHAAEGATLFRPITVLGHSIGSGLAKWCIPCYIPRMSRPIRIGFSDALYHITARGDRREDIFEDDQDRQVFLRILEQVITQFGWLCYAWCLMDNHYHLLIRTPDGNLSRGMRQLNGIYTQASNRRHQRVGHLFQGRFKAILVDSVPICWSCRATWCSIRCEPAW